MSTIFDSMPRIAPLAAGAPIVRTEKGLEYERYLKALLATLRHPNPEELTQLEAQNLVLRTLEPGSTQAVQVLQDMSIAYTNDAYVGTRLMPEAPVAESEGLGVQVWQRDMRVKFDYPTTAISSGGRVNTVSEGVSPGTATLVKGALKETVDIWNERMMQPVVADLVDATTNVLEGMEFNREVAIAAVAAAGASYGANTAAIAAADRWNSAGGGDPGGAADLARRALMGAPGSRLVAFSDLEVFHVLRRHPMILQAVFGSQAGAPKGQMRATLQQLAEYFDVDEYVVASARRITTQEGQAEVYGRIWPHCFGMMYVANNPTRRTGAWGITLAQPRTQLTWVENGTGGKGAYITQVTTAEVSTVMCPLNGYLYTTPIN